MTDHRPLPLLSGLLVGALTLVPAALFIWTLAPLVPLLLGGVIMQLKRTRSFGLGMLAAACGGGVAVLTEFILLP